jgi:hypothetical protein
MNTINDILKYKDTVEVIAKHDKNTWVRESKMVKC